MSYEAEKGLKVTKNGKSPREENIKSESLSLHNAF
jgi:hypothetical protein